MNATHYYSKCNFPKGRDHVLYFSIFLATAKHIVNASIHFISLGPNLWGTGEIWGGSGGELNASFN